MKPLITIAVGLAVGLTLLGTGRVLAQQPLPIEATVTSSQLLSGGESSESTLCCDEVSARLTRVTAVPDRQPEYITLPGDFPAITVTVPASNTAPGYLFVTSFAGPGLPTAAPYVMILDNQGDPVYYRKQSPDDSLRPRLTQRFGDALLVIFKNAHGNIIADT